MHHDNHDHHDGHDHDHDHHSPPKSPTLILSPQKVTPKSDHLFDSLLTNDNSNNNDVIYSDSTSFKLPQSSIESGFQDLSTSSFDCGSKSQIVGGSSTLIGGQCSKYQASNSEELGLGLDASNIQFDDGSNKSGFVRGSLRLVGDEFSSYDMSNSIVSSELGELGLGLDDGSKFEIVETSPRLIGDDYGECSRYDVSNSIVNCSKPEELGLGDDGNKPEIFERSPRLIGDNYGECSRYDVSNSIVNCSKLEELGLGLDDGSMPEIVETSPRVIGDDYGECSRYDVSNSIVNSLKLEDLGLGLDDGSTPEIVETSPRLIDDDCGACGGYEVSKSMDRCLELEESGLGFDDSNLGFDDGSKSEIIRGSSSLIGEEFGECSMYEVSKSSQKMVTCSESEELGLGLDDSNNGLDDGSKTEVVRGSSSLIGEDYGECSRNEVLKSSEEMVRCLESGELGLGLDDSTIGFDNGSKTEIIGGSPRLIGDDYGECGRFEESKSFEMTIGCSDLEELGLGLDDSNVGFDDVSNAEIIGGSPRLIGENYGECSRYEVSKSSEKMVTCSKSEDLGIGLHDSNLGFDDGSKTEIVRESSMLIDEDYDKCSSYEVSKSSEKMVRCSESKELGLGFDDSDLGFDDGSQNKPSQNKYESSMSSGEIVRCSELDKELGLNNSGLDCNDGNKGETPKNKVLLLSDERRRSPRLISSPNVVNYSECSSFEVLNSSGKLVISSESMELELALNKPGVGFDGKSKCKTSKNKALLRTSEKATRRSPRLIDSYEVEVVDGECGRNASANSSGKTHKCSRPMELGLALNPTSVNGKRKMYSLQSSEDQVKTSNKKLKKSDSDNQKGERRSSRLSGLKPEPVVEVEVNLGEKASLQLIKSGKEHVSEGKSRTKCLTPSLSILENMEEKVLRRSPRGLPSTFAVDDDDEWDEIEREYPKKPKKKKVIKEEAPKVRIEKSNAGGKKNCFFVGEPIPEVEALQKWGWRYQLKNRRNNGRSLTGNVNEEDDPILEVKCHYTQARIKGCIFHLGDCALIRGDNQKHIGKIVEFFQTTESEDYFRVQWFYKPEDTVMKEAASFHDKKRLFYSCIMNDNLLVCIISKVNVIQVLPQLNFDSSSYGPSDFYYDMEYRLNYSTFRNMTADNPIESSKLPSLGGPESTLTLTSSLVAVNSSICENYNAELTMLDLYAGCGGMSTGLCIGAKLSGVNLATRWAIDADSSACESLRLNHSNIEVKNETAEDFLELLKQWESLCKKFVVEESQETQKPFASQQEVSNSAEACSDAQSDSDTGADDLEVESLVDICYADTDGSGKRELKFKVRWKGYDQSEDTWEPIEGLSNCEELIQEFVINGFKNKILPLPGSVDVICGGPPCQGISGYNRFRSVEAPLDDEKNRQLVVFMDIVEYLRPKFVLMENVMDILRFDKGSLGRYAMSRLVHMNYQARVGIMAAGCYGLPQFRLRAFFWGALPSEELPQFPLPTHDVVVRYWPPAEFERNVVAYDMDSLRPELEDAVLLGDAISDLPAVTNYDGLDEMPYTRPPETEFQKYIRSTKNDKICSASNAEEAVLYDHRPHQLFEDDYVRVCQIPRRKGANFRDLPGVIVGDDNVVRRDPTIETVFLPSGMPLVPEYAFTFEQGKSKRPFARLWWDENVATIVTYPNCHSSAVLHPEQDRVLTVRECARLQGFPDSYRFSGTVKQRYRQVGNAVAIPVAKALGYALGMAFQRRTNKEPLLTLPPKFAYSDHL